MFEDIERPRASSCGINPCKRLTVAVLDKLSSTRVTVVRRFRSSMSYWPYRDSTALQLPQRPDPGLGARSLRLRVKNREGGPSDRATGSWPCPSPYPPGTTRRAEPPNPYFEFWKITLAVTLAIITAAEIVA